MCTCASRSRPNTDWIEATRYLNMEWLEEHKREHGHEAYQPGAKLLELKTFIFVLSWRRGSGSNSTALFKIRKLLILRIIRVAALAQVASHWDGFGTERGLQGG